jgi:hypothetical protein
MLVWSLDCVRFIVPSAATFAPVRCMSSAFESAAQR